MSYLKLRELSLTYDVPQSLTRPLWSNARYVRLVASGRNLLTFSPYWSNPEDNQTVTSAARGISWDLWSYPMSRSFWFSVDVGF